MLSRREKLVFVGLKCESDLNVLSLNLLQVSADFSSVEELSSFFWSVSLVWDVSCVDRTTVGFDRGGEAYGGSTPCSVFWPRCRRPPPHALTPTPWPASLRALGRATHAAQPRRRGALD